MKLTTVQHKETKNLSGTIRRTAAARPCNRPALMTTKHKATGLRLREMRKLNKLSIDAATNLANEIATTLNSDATFSKNEMRRFEVTGVPGIEHAYGTTPPSLEQIRILLHAYNGSPGYLLLGIAPVLFPTSEFHQHKRLFFDDEMVYLMNLVASWGQRRRVAFMQFIREFGEK